MRVSVSTRLFRLLFSLIVVTAIVTVCVFAPHVDASTVMLVLLLAILIFASQWGLWESIAAAIAGAMLLDYFFLPPAGFGIEAPQHFVALATFLCIALVSGKLAERATAQASQEMERRIESERLYTFARDFAASGSFDVIVTRALDSLVRIFELRAAAYYDLNSCEAVYAGAASRGLIPKERIKTGTSRFVTQSNFNVLLVPISIEGKPIGNLAVCGEAATDSMLRAVAERIEIGLARARAFEQLNEADAVRKSQELASAVLDSLVHEIKTPLSVVKTAATSLLYKDLGATARAELSAMISEEIDQVDSTINEVFWTAQMKSGTLQPEIGPHDIHHLVATSLGELKTRLSARPLKIKIPETLPPADFDFHMIKIVFKELMNNALKYSPDESPLVISAQLEGGEIITEVEDSGIGIRKGEEQRIFERNYRGTAAIPGSGLVLAIAKTIVEAHGGRLGAISVPGKGSTFFFSLPTSLEGLA